MSKADTMAASCKFARKVLDMRYRAWGVIAVLCPLLLLSSTPVSNQVTADDPLKKERGGGIKSLSSFSLFHFFLSPFPDFGRIIVQSQTACHPATVLQISIFADFLLSFKTHRHSTSGSNDIGRRNAGRI
uniref:Uncharacterized protein n=1 Tax=Anguilla anguilla TaxID=7936 RepID=A0A0E9S5Z0_ANGAN